MYKFLLFIVVFITLKPCLLAQNPNSNFFKSPLDIPLYLSGNYGELRAAHFHSGIDLKTQAMPGKPVYASGDGYISRINIQSGGYGKSLYISHPNGYTTVYAHLERFIPEIEAYVKQNQYSEEKFEIELFPAKDMFRFKQSDLIAYSGNTGNSGGPHVHFEIRKTGSQIPMNALMFNLPVEDNRPPVFKGLYIYGYPYDEPVRNAGETRSAYDAVSHNDTSYFIPETIYIGSLYVGFGAEIYDYLNGSSNRCGVYTMQLNIDGQPFFSFTIEGISFEQSRYVNAHMDYELKTHEKKSIHRLYQIPNNKLSIYKKYGRNGLLQMKNDSLHKGEVITTDSYGNRSRLSFSFRQLSQYDSTVNFRDSMNYIRWEEGAIYRSNKINIQIPPAALYEDVYFNYSILPGAEGTMTDTFQIFMPEEPIHEKYTIEVPYIIKDKLLQKKVLFGLIDESKKLIAEGGEYKEGYMKLSTRNFGKYLIVYDTIAPVITPISFIQGKKYSVGKELTFTVTDDLSGLDSYTAYIDGKWALMEYDAKSDLLSYTIDGEKLTPGLLHSIKLIVSDGKQNRSEYEGQFSY